MAGVRLPVTARGEIDLAAKELPAVWIIDRMLDRLARSTRDLLNVLDEIGKRGAGFKSLKDTWADTTTPHGRLMLTVLGGLARSSAFRKRRSVTTSVGAAGTVRILTTCR